MEIIDDRKIFELLLVTYPGKIVTRQTFHHRRDDIQQYQIYDSVDTLVIDLIRHFGDRLRRRKEVSGKYFEKETGFLIIDAETDVEFAEAQEEMSLQVAHLLELRLAEPSMVESIPPLQSQNESHT